MTTSGAKVAPLLFVGEGREEGVSDRSKSLSLCSPNKQGSNPTP